MTAALTFAVILFILLDGAAPFSDHRSRKEKRISNQSRKKLCSNRKLCFLGSKNEASSNSQEIQLCQTNTDCSDGEYCHQFHRLCLRPQEPVTVAPVKTSAKKCAKNANCKSREYCHVMWKICLPFAKEYRRLPTKRPTWYCESTNDCRVDQQCHQRFHTCYSRPHVPAVRRSTPISRKCALQSDCGAKFYCHDHFRICLPSPTSVKLAERTWPKINTCASSEPCENGLECHSFWKICFKPAQNIVGTPDTTRHCQHDGDCAEKEFCHVMAGGARPDTIVTVARLRRSLPDSVCLPLTLKSSPKASKRTMCKTDEECGPNSCCLEKLGVCLAYKLPDEMCIDEEETVDFVCPCAAGSFCREKGKLASPKRIINKMKLSKVAADHLMSSTHKRKYKIGKCFLEPST